MFVISLDPCVHLAPSDGPLFTHSDICSLRKLPNTFPSQYFAIKKTGMFLSYYFSVCKNAVSG